MRWIVAVFFLLIRVLIFWRWSSQWPMFFRKQAWLRLYRICSLKINESLVTCLCRSNCKYLHLNRWKRAAFAFWRTNAKNVHFCFSGETKLFNARPLLEKNLFGIKQCGVDFKCQSFLRNSCVEWWYWYCTGALVWIQSAHFWDKSGFIIINLLTIKV